MPLSDFPDSFVVQTANEGEDVSNDLGITHYTGDQEVESTQSDNGGKPKFRYPKTAKGWFFWALYKLGFRGARRNMNIEMAFHVPSFDVENFKNYKNAIKDGEIVFVAEKIHGSQARYVYKDGVMYAASRNYWKAPDSPCVWRRALAQTPWIEEWCRANEGSILYGEVAPTQKGYTYGCQPGEVKFFVFDIRDKDGNYLPKDDLLHGSWSTLPGIKTVPMLYEGPFDREVIAKLVDGVSAVDGKTQREGIVVTVADPARWERGIGRIQLKWKSSAFLEKDGNR
jgi:RNA ligase (TIGR02306 family)